MALICFAAAAAEPGSLAGFDVELFCRSHGTDKKTVVKIMVALADLGIIVDGRLPPGGVWNHYRTSTERVKRAVAKKREERLNGAPRLITEPGREGLVSPMLGSSTSEITHHGASGEVKNSEETPKNSETVVSKGFQGLTLAETNPLGVLAGGIVGATGSETPELSDAGLLHLLVEACGGRVRLNSADHQPVAAIADVSRIRDVIAAGADLEHDVLPVLRHLVAVDGQPPLPKWPQWVIDEIMACQVKRIMATARGKMLDGVRAAQDAYIVEVTKPVVRGPPPTEAELDAIKITRIGPELPTKMGMLQAKPAVFDMSEVVAGYVAGTLAWDLRRLGPPPGEPGCRISPGDLQLGGWTPAFAPLQDEEEK